MVRNAQLFQDRICQSKLKTKVINSLYMNGFGYPYIEKQSVDNDNTYNVISAAICTYII